MMPADTGPGPGGTFWIYRPYELTINIHLFGVANDDGDGVRRFEILRRWCSRTPVGHPDGEGRFRWHIRVGNPTIYNGGFYLVLASVG
jgi:hypothetical protein